MSRDYVLHEPRPPAASPIDYARELNEQQRAAVCAPPGPALVIAGAGSGKTRTLTYRVAWLLEQGVPAGRLLLLTFTNKAAREMMQRVSDLIGGAVNEAWGGTFHSIGARVLRQHAEAIGLRRDFTILDREDSVDLIKACLADAGIDVKKEKFPKADVLAELFSMAANRCRPLPEIIAQDYDYFSRLTPRLTDLAGRYTARKAAANVMDFDDLLALWLRLLREDTEAREYYQRKFEFLLVDEYQDTNQLQADLIDLLGARHHNIMAVGDDSQSIYAWRGANFRNILDFPKRHTGAKVFKIETNYRSTPEILDVANAAIAANAEQFAKTLAPARPSGARPVVVTCEDSRQQAAFVAQRALELREGGTPLHRMAVLYRSHFHALELQLELTRRQIPFAITSGIRFFEQAHIKDVAAHLKLLCNPADETAFKRLALMLPGVGAKAAEKLWQAFHPAWRESSAEADGRAVPLAPLLQHCAGAAPKKSATAWAALAITVSQLEAEDTRGNPSAMIRLVLDAGYEDYLHDNYANARNRLEDLEQLAAFAGQFQSPEEFLTQLSLLTNVEAEDHEPGRRDEERLRLSTVHQAKGLEFDAVFVIMLCDGLFPSSRSLESAEGEAEERRLFYVAVTRARNELHLCHPLMRPAAGADHGQLLMASRFLKEIPAELVEAWDLKPAYA
jgi:DNA helicase-2/ATP-dependent DNA helicase PcrA